MTRIDIAELHDPDPVWSGLNDSLMLAGVVGSDYDPILRVEDVVAEKIGIHLRGEPELLRQAIRRLEALATQANRYEALRVGDPVVLRLLTSEADGYWYARIFSVSLTGQAGHLVSRDLGAMTLWLSFERENHFESDLYPLSISNAAGGPTNGFLEVANHPSLSQGCSNYADINALLFDSDLPARLRMEVASASSPLGDFYIGALASPINEFSASLNLEAENGTPATIISNNAAAGGAFSQLSWTGNGWTQLTSWVMSSDQLKKLDCNRFMPILRLTEGLSGGPVQFRLSLSMGTSLIYQSPALSLPNGASLAFFNSIRLPLSRTPMFLPLASYTLSLSAQSSASGTHLLRLDDLLLQPQESACLFRSITGLPPDAILTDDSSTGHCLTILNNSEMQTHTRLGKPLEILPGRINRLSFFMTNPEGDAPIHLSCQVKVMTRKRRRVL